MRIFLVILAFCSSINLFAQRIKGRDLGWKAAADFSIVELKSFRSLYQTDSLMTNLKFLGEPTFLERQPYSNSSGFGFEVHFEGLELNYRWSTDFKKGEYEYTQILVNSPIYTVEFRGDRVKVGQSIDTLPESLTAPEIEHSESQNRMLFHFSPVSNSFQIFFDKKSRLITAFEFSNTFY